MASKPKRAQPHRSAVGRVFASATARGVFRFRIGPNGERIPLPRVGEYARRIRALPGLITYERLG